MRLAIGNFWHTGGTQSLCDNFRFACDSGTGSGFESGYGRITAQERSYRY